MATITLYHYTSKEGAKGIERSQRISQSRPTGGKDDANWGPGVYLTSIPPDETTKLDLMFNNYDGTPESILRKILTRTTHKIDKVVVIELPGDLVEQVESERDIFLVRGDIDLKRFDYYIEDGPHIAF